MSSTAAELVETQLHAPLLHALFAVVNGAWGGGHEPALDWADLLCNLVSVALVYAYFSRALRGEGLVAVLVCMGMAAFDAALLGLRCCTPRRVYVRAGGVLVGLQTAYRAVVLPAANSWMCWSLLRRAGVPTSWPVYGALVGLLLAFLVAGLQARYLHAPLHLAAVLVAAISSQDLCQALLPSVVGSRDTGHDVAGGGSDGDRNITAVSSSGGQLTLRCASLAAAVQLSIGLVLPGMLLRVIEGPIHRSVLPHMQVRRLPPPPGM